MPSQLLVPERKDEADRKSFRGLKPQVESPSDHSERYFALQMSDNTQKRRAFRQLPPPREDHGIIHLFSQIDTRVRAHVRSYVERWLQSPLNGPVIVQPKVRSPIPQSPAGTLVKFEKLRAASKRQQKTTMTRQVSAARTQLAATGKKEGVFLCCMVRPTLSLSRATGGSTSLPTAVHTCTRHTPTHVHTRTWSPYAYIRRKSINKQSFAVGEHSLLGRDAYTSHSLARR